jgi:hypothetical protein
MSAQKTFTKSVVITNDKERQEEIKIDREKSAREFENSTYLYMIKSPKNLSELEREKDLYLSMPVDHQILSDSESIRLFGIGNTERYNVLRARFELIEDKESDEELIVAEYGVVIQNDDTDSLDDHVYDLKDPDKISAARVWMRNSGFVMMIPDVTEEELEAQWSRFHQMPIQDQRMSDDEALKIFGQTNQEIYDDIKQSYSDDSDSGSFDYTRYGMVEVLKEVSEGRLNGESAGTILMQFDYDSKLIDRVITEALSEEHAYIESHPIYKVFPMYRFDDLMTLVPGLDSTRDNDVKKIHKCLQGCDDICYGTSLFDNDIQRLWYDKLSEAFKLLETSNDKESVHKKILELGWSPYVPFNREAAERAGKYASENQRKIFREFDVAFDKIGKGLSPKTAKNILEKRKRFRTPEEYLKTFSMTDTIKKAKDQVLFPLYVVFSYTETLAGIGIRHITGSEFTHAGISFDPKLDKMFSFNMANEINPNKLGGFSIENLAGFNKGNNSKMSIFVMFVDKATMLKIQKTIDWYLANIEKSRYSFMNAAAAGAEALTKIGIKGNHDKLRMICSSFVASIISIADKELLKGSWIPDIHPGNLRTKIYKISKEIFNGKIAEYNAEKIKRISDNLLAQRLKRETRMAANEFRMLLIDCVNNMELLSELALHKSCLPSRDIEIFDTLVLPQRELIVEVSASKTYTFPIEFDKEGNLYIVMSKTDKMDVWQEYNQTHRLLTKYKKHKDYDNIKKCLAKLWHMDLIIEYSIYDKKKKVDFTNEKNIKLRDIRKAILSDWSTGMDFVLEHESSFDFEEYYSKSYGIRRMKIEKSTLQHMLDYGEQIGTVVKKVITA